MPHLLRLFRSVKVPLLFLALLAGSMAVDAAGAPESRLSQGHRIITGVVTEKAGALVVTTPEGASHQLNANLSRRHGHPPFKAGDEVIAELDENNYIVDMHLKGEEGTHRLITGTLIHVGKTKKEIKLHTPEGERVFPLAEQGLKTKDLPNGSRVTVELNEAGAVIDLHQADPGTDKK